MKAFLFHPRRRAGPARARRLRLSWQSPLRGEQRLLDVGLDVHNVFQTN
jgi:hypothetical protein